MAASVSSDSVDGADKVNILLVDDSEAKLLSHEVVLAEIGERLFKASSAREAFECLAPRERKVAVLLYVYNLTLREIGEILGVTESRVCQIHGQITKKLRADLEADEQLFSEVA